jgi:hypothetical protein
MWLALAMLTAWLIAGLPRPVIAALVAVIAISPALVATWHVASTPAVMTVPQERAGRWIAAETPGDAIFVTDPYINSPVDLAGRLRITGFGQYVANLGIEPVQREADVLHAYCDGPDAAIEVMHAYGATHVLSSGGNLFAACGDREPTDFRGSQAFETIYDEDGVAVWFLLE